MQSMRAFEGNALLYKYMSISAVNIECYILSTRCISCQGETGDAGAVGNAGPGGNPGDAGAPGSKGKVGPRGPLVS